MPGKRQRGAAAGAGQPRTDGLLFDRDFYLAANPDVAAAGIDPLQHFLQYGLDESRDPHPLVDIAHLRSQAGDGPFDLQRVADLLADPAIQPHPLFDPAFYLAENPDVAAAGLAPMRHYIEHGAAEGRSPRAGFDPDRYLRQFPEAGTDRYQAFVHFVRVGHPRGTAPAADTQDVSATLAVSVPQGVLDAVDGLVARGWAYVPDAPPGGTVVEIMDGDCIVGRGNATEFRRDLEGMGFGDAHCGFAIPVSRCIADGQEHVLRARFTDGSLLQGAVEVQVQPTVDLPYDLVPRGVVSEVAARIAAGWDEERSDGFEAVMHDASLLLETGQVDAASRELHAVGDRYPGNPLANLLLALAQLGLGRGDLALGSARSALGEPALEPWAWLAIGNASRLLGHWSEAGEAFRKARALRPDLGVATSRLEEVEERAVAIEARRLLAKGDRALALQALVPALLKWPRSSRLQDLVFKARTGSPGESLSMDASCREAIRSVVLLGAVVDHLRAHRASA